MQKVWTAQLQPNGRGESKRFMIEQRIADKHTTMRKQLLRIADKHTHKRKLMQNILS